MTREKHGQYNEEKHLPDNTGRPVGSGWIIRWQQEVQGIFPNLYQRALGQKGNRAQWLLKELQTISDDEQAQALVESYIQKRKRDSLVREQQKRLRFLAGFRDRAAETGEPLYEKRAATLEKEIARAQEKHGFTEEELQ